MNKNFSTFLYVFVFTTILFTLFNFSSCNETPVDPYDKLKPGRRDYVWEVDTLDTRGNIIYKIWGSSPTNVWAAGVNGDFSRNIWHYDGNKWTTDGINRNIIPYALWGFTYDDIYIGGVDGKIWRFDGEEWKPFVELKKEGIDFFAFQNIWGAKPNDFYAVGSGPDNKLYANHSIIVHFIGDQWEFFNTKELKGNVVHFYINKPDKKKYFGLIKIGGITHQDSTIIYEYDEGKYKKLYSSVETKGKQAFISLIGDEVYFILGDKVATRVNEQFKTVVKINSPNFYQRIWGRSAKDIFLLMVDGLAHYNGTNIEYLFYFNKTPRTQIYGAALFDKEVFFSVYEDITGLKYIYHGKLE